MCKIPSSILRKEISILTLFPHSRTDSFCGFVTNVSTIHCLSKKCSFTIILNTSLNLRTITQILVEKSKLYYGLEFNNKHSKSNNEIIPMHFDAENIAVGQHSIQGKINIFPIYHQKIKMHIKR